MKSGCAGRLAKRQRWLRWCPSLPLHSDRAASQPSPAARRLQVKSSYYAPLVAARQADEGALGTHIFASKPAAGAAVLTVKL